LRAPTAGSQMPRVDLRRQRPDVRVLFGSHPDDLRHDADRAPGLRSKGVDETREHSGPGCFFDAIIAFDVLRRVSFNLIEQGAEKRVARSGGEDAIRELPRTTVAKRGTAGFANPMFDAEHATRAGEYGIARAVGAHIEVGIHSAIEVNGQVAEQVNPLNHAG